MADDPSPKELPGRSGGRFSLLVASLALFFFSYPLTLQLGGERLHRLALVVVCLAAVGAVSRRRTALLVAGLLCLPAVVAQVVALSWPSPAVLAVGLSFAALFFAYVIRLLLAAVMGPGRVDGDRVAGAVSVYLLLGLAWAMVYALILLADPAAFRLPAAPPGGVPVASSRFLYFSFVTLTTLGFGDISPASVVAQTAAWMEAVVGQLFLVVLVARLVGLQIAQETAGR